MRREWLRAALAVSIPVAFVAAWPLSRAATPRLGGLALFALLLVGGSLAWGELVARLDRRRTGCTWDAALTLPAGMIVVSALTLAAVFAWGRAASDFVGVTLLGIALVAGWPLRDGDRRLRATRFSAAGLLALGVASTATTLWLLPRFAPPANTGGVLVYRFWRDAFIHSGWIGILGGPASPLASGHPEMAGLALPWYHYGSYMVPAAGARLAGLTGLEAVDSVWTPLGMLLVPLVAFGVVERLFGALPGLAALAAVCLVPDASFYGLKVSVLGAYWLQQAAPSLSWGIACAGIGLLLVVAGTRCTDARLVGLGWLLGVATVLFKAHVAVVAMPLLLAWPLLFARRIPVRRRLPAGLAVLFGLAVAGWGIRLSADAPTLSLAAAGGNGFLRFLSRGVDDPRLNDLLLDLLDRSSNRWLALGWQVPFLLVAVFGAFLALYAAILWFRVRTRTFEATDLLPILVMAIQVALSLGTAANTRGNPFELQHRTFTWSYLLVAAWCGAALGIWLARRIDEGRRRWALVAVPALLIFPLVSADTIRGVRIRWSRPVITNEIPLGLAAAAGFLRSRAGPRDLVQDSEADPADLLFGLSERRAFLARPERRVLRGSSREVVDGRLRVVADLLHAGTAGELTRACGGAAFDWLVVHPDSAPPWREVLAERAALEADGFSVYRVSDLCSSDAIAELRSRPLHPVAGG